MAERILEVEGLSKRFGGFVALDAVSLHLDEGERLGLIGPNGSGKTTMINCISGALACDGGTVVFKGQDVTRMPAYRRVRLGITRSFQIPARSAACRCSRTSASRSNTPAASASTAATPGTRRSRSWSWSALPTAPARAPPT